MLKLAVHPKGFLGIECQRAVRALVNWELEWVAQFINEFHVAICSYDLHRSGTYL